MKRTLQHETDVVHRKAQRETNVSDSLQLEMSHWFTTRIERLCKELGVTKSALGLGAGISHATIGKWMRQAEAGKFNPSLREVEKLAAHTGKPVAWFLREDAETTTPSVAVLTAADLDKAATRLTKYDGVPPEEAWSLMRRLIGGSDPEELYFAARHIRNGGTIEEQHRGGVEQMKRGAAPVRRVTQS